MIAAPANFVTANEELAKQPIYLIEIEDLTAVFVNRWTGIADQVSWIVSIDPQSTTINEFDGTADLGEFSFTILDFEAFITSLFPTFTFEGKRVTLKTGFLGMAQVDFATLFTGEIDHVDNVLRNTAYKFFCSDATQPLSQVIYQTADDGLPTSSDHIKTLNGHPLDMLMDIFDAVGVNYDAAKIIAYRDGIFSGTQFLFELDSPPAANDFIANQLLKPLAGYLWTNNLGQLSVNFIYPQSLSTVFDITESQCDVPEGSQSDLVNVINYRYDHDRDQNKFMTEVVQEDGVSVAKYGQFGQKVIESDGMRSSYQAFFLSAISSAMLFRRYGLKALKFDKLNIFWKAVTLEPGDLVTVTNSKVPDRLLGVIGITSKKFVVMDRSWDFKAGKVSLLLLDATYLLNFGVTKITGNGEADYAAASAADKAAYMFMCNDSDQYSTGAAANLLG